MKIKNIIYSIILSAFISTAVNGQGRMPHSLYFMETIPQTVQMNPAHQPRANTYVSFPAANYGLDLHLDFAAKDLLQKHGNVHYTPIEKEYDYNKLWNSIGKKATMINFSLDFDLLGFGFRTGAGKGYFSFGMSQHAAIKFAVPSDLLKIFENFFPDNSHFDFSPLRVQAAAYMQFRFGYSHKINEKLTIGVNMKPIFGQASVTTRFNELELRTGLNEWSFKGDGEILLSAPEVITKVDINAEDDKIETQNVIEGFEAMDFVNKYMLKNPGVSFDFGAVYQVNERFSVSAALNNFGFISWKEDLSRLRYKGEYAFDIDEITIDNLDDLDNFGEELFEKIEDGLLSQLELDNNSFSTSLTPVFYAGASYNLTQGISAGLLSRTTFWQNGVRQSFNLSLNMQPYSFFALTTGATWQVKGNLNLCGGFMFFLGPLQLYVLSDYIPVYYSSYKIGESFEFPYLPERQKTITFRFGLNLIFGKHGYINKPMLGKGTSSWN